MENHNFQLENAPHIAIFNSSVSQYRRVCEALLKSPPACEDFHAGQWPREAVAAPTSTIHYRIFQTFSFPCLKQDEFVTITNPI